MRRDEGKGREKRRGEEADRAWRGICLMRGEGVGSRECLVASAVATELALAAVWHS